MNARRARVVPRRTIGRARVVVCRREGSDRSASIDSELIIHDAVGTDGNIEGLGKGRGDHANRAETRGELQRLFCVQVLLGGRASTESGSMDDASIDGGDAGATGRF